MDADRAVRGTLPSLVVFELNGQLDQTISSRERGEEKYLKNGKFGQVFGVNID